MGFKPISTFTIPGINNNKSTNPQRAGNGIRTRDLKLGKLSLCQLSYSRKYLIINYLSHSGDLNPRPAVYETAALPAELKWQFFCQVPNLEIIDD
jgi:hypothetical protein